jgi:hypothetical protein
MPNAPHRDPQITTRAPRALANAVSAQAKRDGTNRNAITVRLWEWYAGLPGATLPERPAAP